MAHMQKQGARTSDSASFSSSDDVGRDATRDTQERSVASGELSKAASVAAAPSQSGVFATMRNAGHAVAGVSRRIAKQFKFFERGSDGKYKFKRPHLQHPGVFMEIIIYLCFLTTFSIVVFYMRDPQFSYSQNEVLRKLVLSAEIPGIKIYKSFYGVATPDEFWEWAKGPLITALMTDQGSGPMSLYGTNYLIGLARLRQVRIAARGCTIPAAFKTLVPVCYGRYTHDKVSRTAFGPGGMWTYKSKSELGINNQLARWNSYDGGGFVHDIGGLASASDEIAALQFLNASGWLDLQTRAVFVDFTTYNPNVNLFTVMQLQFEFLPSGGVFPDFKFRVLRLLSINNQSGKLYLAAEIVLVAFVFFSIGEELSEIVRDIWRHRRWLRRRNKVQDAEVATETLGLLRHSWTQYWRDGWNYFDLLNVFLFAAAFIAHIKVIKLYDAMEMRPFDRSRFYNFQEIVLWDALEKNLLACNAVMLWFKIFKYTKFSPRMSMIASVSSAAFKPMLFFLMLFAVVIFGFAQAGVLAFGADVKGYDTLGLTFLTMLLAALGDFDFVGLQHSNRFFGPLFFFTFVVLVVFVILSMFLAIVDNSYDDVRREISRSREPTFVQRSLAWASTTKPGSWIVNTFSLQAKVARLHKSIRRADRNEDGLLDKNELRDVIAQAEGYFDGTIDEIFALYDKDRDNELDADEQVQLLRDVALKHQRVAENVLTLRETGGLEANTLFDLISERIDRSERRMIVGLESVVAALDPEAAEGLRARRKLPKFATSASTSLLFKSASVRAPPVESTGEKPHWAVSAAVSSAIARKRKLTLSSMTSPVQSSPRPSLSPLPQSEMRKRSVAGTAAKPDSKPSTPALSQQGSAVGGALPKKRSSTGVRQDSIE